MRGVCEGKRPLGKRALVLWGSDSGPGSVRASPPVHSLVGVGAKGQQELHSRAMAQQR